MRIHPSEEDEDVHGLGVALPKQCAAPPAKTGGRYSALLPQVLVIQRVWRGVLMRRRFLRLLEEAADESIELPPEPK